ncbi:histidine kinase dimerization/phospho-acceptor domain-containing protein [Paenibacillus algorifonticola]|uniref:histidine kinase dimerization/phospho-acceptor domain-containing protein n=1 Tax=Paenibacillus algorifonticola TaxID=684063 RepID=UPI003D276DAB
MNRKPSLLHLAINFTLALSALLVCWIGSFYITKSIFSALEWTPHDLLSLLINAVLGFCFFGMGIAVIGKYFRPKEHYFLNDMLEALKRISQGDFRVNLEWEFGRNNEQQRHPYVQLVDSINSMAANLKEMEELRQEFISNVSHEIGSPLTSISGFAKALKDDKLDVEQRHRSVHCP